MMIQMQMRDLNFFMFMIYTVNAVFGVLFLKFSSDEELNNKCSNSDFQTWAKVTGLSCLSFAFLAFLFVLLIPCGRIFFQNFLVNLLYACLINSLICVFGLNYSIDENCGYLSTLSSVYLISTMIVYALCLLVLCIILCIFTGVNVMMNPNGTGTNDEAQEQVLPPQQQQQPFQLGIQGGAAANAGGNNNSNDDYEVIPIYQQNQNNMEPLSYDSLDVDSNEGDGLLFDNNDHPQAHNNVHQS